MNTLPTSTTYGWIQSTDAPVGTYTWKMTLLPGGGPGGGPEAKVDTSSAYFAPAVDSIVPGHFELAGKPELKRFRDYLSDLYTQVHNLYEKRATLEEVRRDIHMEKYSDFRQYPKYEATFADNAETIYHELQQQ